MKLAFKIIGTVLLLLVLVIVTFYVYLEMTWKKDYSGFASPSLAATADSATIVRGEYLANAVAHCSACHQGGAEMANRSGTNLKLDYAGGHVWDVPPFGKFVASNLTSDPESGIGAVSDALLARTIRHGIDRHGRIAAFMGFAVGQMADQDLVAILSYLRTLPPVKTSHPAEEYGLIGKFVAKKLDPARKTPPPKWVAEGGISVERGEYLAKGPAMCAGCHSVADPMNGFALEEPLFQGAGQADPDPLDPAFEIVAPNLTPDPETGHITAWSEEDFLKRFRAGVVYKGSPMPWENYARLTEDDIRSLYRYLRTLAPAKHPVGPTHRAKGSWQAPKA